MEETEIKEPSPKKKMGKRGKITAAIVACVVVVAAIGFWVWHEQPSFCNAICHTPMDKYAETYFADRKSDDATLVTTHALMNKTCLDCHPAEIGQQINEGIHWVTGDYGYDTETGKLVSRSSTYGTAENCMQSGCHSFTLDELREKTSKMEWNPHDFTEHGVTDCGDCHKMHDTSVYVCTQCHYQAVNDVPKGWDSIEYKQEV